jgi:NADPH:quinone reductase
MPEPHGTMRAVVLDAYLSSIEEAIASLRIVERPVPRPGPGEVLVRMAAAPCNPSDLMFLQGQYGENRSFPAVPGREGAGTVVASGGGLLARLLVGRCVACGRTSDRDGTWAEYFVARVRECAPLPRSIGIEQGAASLINPLTCLGLLEAARGGRHPAALQTAAASQVGKMLARLFRAEGIPLVGIVRRDDQIERTLGLGAGPVLCSADPDFERTLESVARDLGATIAFDAVAGEMTGRLLAAMPGGGEVVVYGALSGDPCADVGPMDLIARAKNVRGFYLGNWLRRKGAVGTWLTIRRSQRRIANGELRTEIAMRVPIDEVRAGLSAYLARRSDGKALILMGSELESSIAPRRD